MVPGRCSVFAPNVRVLCAGVWHLVLSVNAGGPACAGRTSARQVRRQVWQHPFGVCKTGDDTGRLPGPFDASDKDALHDTGPPYISRNMLDGHSLLFGLLLRLFCTAAGLSFLGFFFCRYLDVGAGAESGGPRCLLSAPGFGPSSGGVPGQDMLLHTIPAGRDPEFRDVVGGARPWLARSDYDVVRRAVYGRIARGGLAAVLVLSLARSRAGSLRPQGRGYAVTPPGSSQVLLGFASGQFPLHVPLKPELFDSRNPCDLESLRAPRSGPRGVHPHLCSPQVLLIA